MHAVEETGIRTRADDHGVWSDGKFVAFRSEGGVSVGSGKENRALERRGDVVGEDLEFEASRAEQDAGQILSCLLSRAFDEDFGQGVGGRAGNGLAGTESERSGTGLHLLR